MKRLLLLWHIVVFVFFLVPYGHCADGTRRIEPTPRPAKQLTDFGVYKALIIGINDYNDTKIRKLKTAVKDAEAMAEVLGKEYGFSEITLLRNKAASKESIYNALRNLAETTDENDSVLIYYAGHGELDRVYKDGWWVPVDAGFGDNLSYLSNTEVQKALRSMKARHVLLVSDSCYAGTLFGTGRSISRAAKLQDERYYLGLYQEQSRWGITSGNKEPVSDDGSEGHSVFAYQLLKELKKTSQPYFSARNLYDRIAPIIGNNSEQTPICQPIRNTGDQGGEFVFVRVASVGETPLLPPESVSMSDYDSVIAARNAAKDQWEAWQRKMAENYATVEKYDRSEVLKPEEKKNAWQKFLASYEADNPYSPVDESLRDKAGKRMEFWATTMASEPVADVSSSDSTKQSLPATYTDSVTGMEFVYVEGGTLFDKGLALYREQKYEEACIVLREYLVKEPKGSMAPNAQFLLGNSLFEHREYEYAIIEYQKVVADYPKHDQALAALLKQGLSFERLKDNDTAKLVYQKLLEDFPKSEQARTAKRWLEKSRESYRQEQQASAAKKPGSPSVSSGKEKNSPPATYTDPVTFPGNVLATYAKMTKREKLSNIFGKDVSEDTVNTVDAFFDAFGKQYPDRAAAKRPGANKAHIYLPFSLRGSSKEEMCVEMRVHGNGNLLSKSKNCEDYKLKQEAVHFSSRYLMFGTELTEGADLLCCDFGKAGDVEKWNVCKKVEENGALTIWPYDWEFYKNGRVDSYDRVRGDSYNYKVFPEDVSINSGNNVSFVAELPDDYTKGSSDDFIMIRGVGNDYYHRLTTQEVGGVFRQMIPFRLPIGEYQFVLTKPSSKILFWGKEQAIWTSEFMITDQDDNLLKKMNWVRLPELRAEDRNKF